MAHTIASQIRQLAGDVHREESGAIALAALAALIILLMVGLTIWDAGKSARDKIDVQNAADTAAYSQASVRARTMNMLAFTNTAKRSISGMHSMYVGMFSAYVLWWERRCFEAQSSFSSEAQLDCTRDRPLVLRETFGDWQNFTGIPANSFLGYGPQGGNPVEGANKIALSMMFSAGLRNDSYRNEMIALDDYQRYMVEITPWWAWTESLVRGTRNGATVATSYPVPGPVSAAAGTGWIADALSGTPPGVQNYSISNPTDTDASDTAWHDYSVGTNPGNLLRRGTATETCLPNDGGMNLAVAGFTTSGNDDRSPATGTMASVIADTYEVHRRRSDMSADEIEILLGGLQIALDATPPGVWGNAGNPPAGGGCFWSTVLFGDYAEPYHLQADTNSAADLMSRSSIVFTYKYTPGRKLDIIGGQVRGEGATARKRNLIPGSGYSTGNDDSVTFRTHGYWSIARSEIVYPGMTDTINAPAYDEQGAGGIWLWRPGWTAKLRPLALPGEWNQLPFDLNAAYHTTNDYLMIAESIGLLDQVDNAANHSAFAEDLRFMEKATRTLDSQAIEGSVK